MRGVKSREIQKWKKTAIFIVLLLLFGVLLNSVRKVYVKKQNATAALTKMQTDLTELKDREETLERSLKRLSTQEGIEYELRKNFSIARAGEEAAVIVSELPSTSTPPATLPPWQRLKNFFNDLFD